MPKTIDTLVDDIYSLFDPSKPTEFNPDNVKEFGNRLAQHITNRISEERGPPQLRLSNIGTECQRKLWYTVQQPDKAEPLSPNIRFKFLYGDILEELLLFLAKESGHDVQGCQDQVDISGVKGHRDAVIDGRVVDVKSASTFSFKKFASNGLRDDDPFGYIDQLGGYLHAGQSDELVTEKDVASFLVVDKTLGNICLDTYPKPETDYEAKVESLKEMLQQPEPPERTFDDVPEGKSGNRKLCTQCSYCSFKTHCWPELRTFTYAKGPVFLTKVDKEPKVIEASADF